MTQNRAPLISRESEREPATSSQPRTLRILLVEDDDEMRTLLLEQLTRYGYQVDAVSSALEFLDRSADTLFRGAPLASDLIITDLRMPLVTGLELLTALREVGCFVPCILMTAFATTTAYAHASRLGRVTVLDKPFELTRLRALMQEMMEVAESGASSLGER